MHLFTTIADLRRWRAQQHATLGLVPTMGALHAGHVSLLRAARAQCDIVVASLFVNPLQFAPNEDLARYPRTFDEDRALLESEGVDALFAPTPDEMYPSGSETLIDVPSIGSRLDGASRPGHFRGVATVVAKLFHVIQPERAYFGQKDAAQVAVLRAMVRDLNFDLELIVCPTVRDADGLALSSRNRYLSPAEREQALALPNALHRVASAFTAGQVSAAILREDLRQALASSPGVRLDYAELVHPDTLLPVATAIPGTLVAVAAHLGGTRLIDNLLLPNTGGTNGKETPR